MPVRSRTVFSDHFISGSFLVVLDWFPDIVCSFVCNTCVFNCMLFNVDQYLYILSEYLLNILSLFGICILLGIACWIYSSFREIILNYELSSRSKYSSIPYYFIGIWLVHRSEKAKFRRFLKKKWVTLWAPCPNFNADIRIWVRKPDKNSGFRAWSRTNMFYKKSVEP